MTVYAGAPVCAAAKERLVHSGSEAGSVGVRVRCTAPVERGTGAGARLDPATAGANARRATEDSTAVAYLEAPGRAPTFITPILDEADLGMFVGPSGAASLSKVLGALADRSSGESPRESVWALAQSP